MRLYRVQPLTGVLKGSWKFSDKKWLSIEKHTSVHVCWSFCSTQWTCLFRRETWSVILKLCHCQCQCWQAPTIAHLASLIESTLTRLWVALHSSMLWRSGQKWSLSMSMAWKCIALGELCCYASSMLLLPDQPTLQNIKLTVTLDTATQERDHDLAISLTLILIQMQHKTSQKYTKLLFNPHLI